jgi:ABC-2 type transport system permease protein
MIWPLFKLNFRNNRGLLGILALVYALYSMMLISIFNPNSVKELNTLIEAKMPKSLLVAMGIHVGTDLLSFMATILYGVILYIVPMILMVSVNNQLVAAMVEKGSMAFLLATPHSRKRIAITQAVYSVFAVTALFAVLTTVDSAFASIVYPGRLAVFPFIKLNGYAILLFYALSGISFLASVVANETRVSYMFGAGIPFMFVLFDMLANSGGKLAWFKYVTLFTLFEPDRLFAGDVFASIGMVVFTILSIFLYSVSIVYFSKKDLAI